MVFTREDILKIYNALLQLGRKDSEFKDANTPLNSDDYITILQDGINKKVSINNLLSTLGLLKKDDFINVSDRYDEYYIHLSEAITIIANNKRKKGLVITFLDIDGNWRIYLFIGELSNFIITDYWKDLHDFKYPIINTVLPDEEDLTLTYPNIEGNSFIKLKDKEYNLDNFSGLGKVILRKNIVEVEDPTYGKIKKNILYQDMINKENTIYVIQYDFTLGEDITIPENCILEFDGGNIYGEHTLIGNETEIIGNFNVTKVSGIFYKDNKEVNPISIFKWGSITENYYYYIDTQKQFDNFLTLIRTNSNINNKIYAVVAPKRFIVYENGSPLWTTTWKNFNIVGIDGATIEYASITEYERNDAVEITDNFYKCPLKSTINDFPVFYNEKDEKISVNVYGDNSNGAILIPISNIPIIKDLSIKIPIGSYTDLTNKTFNNGFGIINTDWSDIKFRLNYSDNDYLYGTLYSNSSDRWSHYTNYGIDIPVYLYNIRKGYDVSKVYWDNEYIYIPNNIVKLKHKASCIKNNNIFHGEPWKRSFVNIQRNNVSIDIQGLCFINWYEAPVSIDLTDSHSQSSEDCHITIRNCEFINCASCLRYYISLENSANFSHSFGVYFESNKVLNCGAPIENSTIIFGNSRGYGKLTDIKKVYLTITSNTFIEKELPYYPGNSFAYIKLNSYSIVSNNNFIGIRPDVIMGSSFAGNINNNIFSWDNNSPMIKDPLLCGCDNGIIYIDDVSNSYLDNHTKLEETKFRVNIYRNIIKGFTPKTWQTSNRGIYLDNGRGNVIISENLIFPMSGASYAIDARNVDGNIYSSNRVMILRNVIFNSYRLICSLSLKTGFPTIGNNIQLNGNRIKGNLVEGIDLSLPEEFQVDAQNMVVLLPKSYAVRNGITSDSYPVSIYLSKNNYGDSNNRPELVYVGFQYFDTTLNKPIYWTGTDWVDANGIEV